MLSRRRLAQNREDRHGYGIMGEVARQSGAQYRMGPGGNKRSTLRIRVGSGFTRSCAAVKTALPIWKTVGRESAKTGLWPYLWPRISNAKKNTLRYWRCAPQPCVPFSICRKERSASYAELLVVRAGYRLNGRWDARLLDLLQIWGRSAFALQKEEIAAAARLQSDLLED
jgi:hypothetical protein